MLNTFFVLVNELFKEIVRRADGLDFFSEKHFVSVNDDDDDDDNLFDFMHRKTQMM